jgi:translation initiation factor 5B
MAPKKKANKKNDDWESELGEAPESASAAPETKDEPADADPEDEFPAGGLMAVMRKKQKKNKKGKQTEDFVEGEDPPTEDKPDMAEKAPVEASIEDEFALPEKKGKGKNAPARPAKDDEDEDEEERGVDGKVLTKAQKERLKKEREKQRKKENVSLNASTWFRSIVYISTGRKEEDCCTCCQSRSSKTCR